MPWGLTRFHHSGQSHFADAEIADYVDEKVQLSASCIGPSLGVLGEAEDSAASG